MSLVPTQARDEPREEDVAMAQSGDHAALERLVVGLQDPIYGLALRMLWHPEDARDATQEILLKVITHLADFRGESALITWVYRIAANHLIGIRRSRIEEQHYSFDRFADELDEGLGTQANRGGPEQSLLLEEIKLGCTLAMLQCLDRPHRLAYILGEILELESRQAASILELAPDAFRKRLSRARSAIVDFMRAKCGLVRPANACRCHRRVEAARRSGRVDASHPLFAHDPEAARRFPQVLAEIRGLHEARRAVALYRSHSRFSPPADFAASVREILASRA